MFGVYIFEDKKVMKFDITYKTGELQVQIKASVRRNKIVLRITFEIATSVLNEFFHLWSSDLI